jgi:hypothetical protein
MLTSNDLTIEKLLAATATGSERRIVLHGQRPGQTCASPAQATVLPAARSREEASALLSAETGEAATLPCLAGEQGSELTGANVLSADELEGCEIGEQ